MLPRLVCAVTWNELRQGRMSMLRWRMVDQLILAMWASMVDGLVVACWCLRLFPGRILWHLMACRRRHHAVGTGSMAGAHETQPQRTPQCTLVPDAYRRAGKARRSAARSGWLRSTDCLDQPRWRYHPAVGTTLKTPAFGGPTMDNSAINPEFYSSPDEK